MTHSLKRSRSRFEWFRMDVPKRHQARVGKTSWQESLHTTDQTLAAARRAELSAYYKRFVHRLDTELAAATPDKVAAYVEACLRRLADCNGGSMDQAIAGILSGIADKVRGSWSSEDQRAIDERRCTESGDGIYIYDDAPLPLLAFDREADRDLYLLREQLLERRGVVDGIVYQELARLLLQRGLWQAAPVFLLPFVVPDEEGLTDLHEDLVAETLFTRLVRHVFTSWPANAALAFSTVDAPARPATEVPAALPIGPNFSQRHNLASPTVSEAFAAWRAHTKARLKSQDEFGSAIRRFIAAFGDMTVEQVDRKTAREFRNLLKDLPAQLPRTLRELSPREQVAHAATHKLRTLSPTTVKKQLQALYTTLRHARDEMDATVVADVFGVSVDCSEIMGDERLGFSAEQMRTLFSAPIMTSAAGDDASFWFMLLGPFTGCRIEELAQLRPRDVRTEDSVTFIDIRRETVRERRKKAGEGLRGKGVKTRTSLRRVPLHPVLVDAGFLDLVESAKSREADWLFDLRTYQRYEQRGKQMSNKLNRLIDAAGITDAEYVYHSFRHTLKQVLRDLESVKEEISDLLTGHSFAVSVGRKYGRGAGLHTLQRAVNQICYPGVDWTAVANCGRTRVVRGQADQAC